MSLFVFGIYKNLLLFLYPKYCLFCGKKGQYLCGRCRLSRFQYWSGITCFVCKKAIYRNFIFKHQDCGESYCLDGVFPVVYYNKTAKKIISVFKYELCSELASELGFMMKLKYAQLPVSIDFLVPVPLYASKFRRRGFNQAELLAKKVSWNTRNVLSRIRNTRTQVGKDKYERMENVRNAFKLKTVRNIAGKKILLIDDVMTTGSTLEECAGILKLAGAEKVYALVWARES